MILSDILGNSTEIYQVLLNLCVNAKEAIEEKGKIY
jgi:nitrogen-specific signal transduction histidine kinase